MCRAMYSSMRANTGCTAADWANARAGMEFKRLRASADFVLLDKNLRRVSFMMFFVLFCGAI
jgi:hypothetical protein